jgi:hypothetical protein
LGAPVLRLECLTPRSSRRSARPSPALDQMVTALDALRPAAGQRPPARAGSFFGTKRTLSRISPRSGVEGRPEVVGAVQNDEIDATRMSRIRRHGHKPRTSFTVDDRDRCPASGPSASMSPPNASSTSLVSTLVFWPSNASSMV